MSENISKSRSNSSTFSGKTVSTIESSVTKLLISTKLLLQRLTQWSKSQASEKNVSDAYVQLGNDFKLVSKHFSHTGVDVSDLGDVPMDLRKVLEVALREKPSEETLNKYLPRIREIIVKLLDKLKAKQSILKSLKQELRSSSGSNTYSLPSLGTTPDTPVHHRESDSFLNKMPRRHEPNLPNDINTICKQSPIDIDDVSGVQFPKQRYGLNEDPLSQLKKGETLQRRASKRFSAYHMAKLAYQSTSDATSNAPDLTIGSISKGDSGVLKVSEYSKSEDLMESNISSPKATSNSENSLLARDSIFLFLHLNDKVKKCQIDLPLTFNKIRLLFVEKFSYSPESYTLPEIYIKDNSYDIFYELEENQLCNIKEGSSLQLRSNTSQSSEVLDMIKSLKEEFIQRETSIISELKTLILNIPFSSTQQSIQSLDKVTQKKNNVVALSEIKAINYELSILKQAHTSVTKSIEDNVSNILEKLKMFHPTKFDGSVSSNRLYMEKSHSKLSNISDALLSKVDDLQDIIEALRKDVAIRGAKPTKKKIETVKLEVKQAQDDLKSMEKYIEIEKPNWKKIWEDELDKVCEEQQFLALQEDLSLDLKEDLSRAMETFNLVKLCCDEQEKNPKKNKYGHILPVPKPGSFNQVREQMLLEVQNLHPDHEYRVNAIEKAEKLREIERNYKENSAFEDELENFVETNAFKNSVGIDAIEELRKQKDEINLREALKGKAL